MAKRKTGVGRNKDQKPPHKTAKRKAVKKAMLAKKAMTQKYKKMIKSKKN